MLTFIGSKKAEIRLNVENRMEERLYTEKAKEIYKLILEMNPNEWTKQDLKETHKKYVAK